MNSEIIMYYTADGLTKIETTFDGDTVWLSIDQMSELFQRDRSVIGKHIRNIFKEGELEKNSVWAKFAYTASDGKDYQVDYYNLDVIISVGYRVKSLRGTQFRIWASNVLKEYIKKGFAMNDDLLKNNGGGIYFDELLERIGDIRSSEKVFWRKVLDIYATSVDYDPRTEVSTLFFQDGRIRCIGQLMGKLQQKRFITRQMRINLIWKCLVLKENSLNKRMH